MKGKQIACICGFILYLWGAVMKAGDGAAALAL